MSSQPCGCDPEANWKCTFHGGSRKQDVMNLSTVLPVNYITAPEPTGTAFVIKDSGTRQSFEGGMVRDTAEGKTNYLLTRDGPMYERWAVHLTKGAKKYEARNWLKGQGPEVMERARESAVRHFEAWLRGDVDEDHAAALYFNVNQCEEQKRRTL